MNAPRLLAITPGDHGVRRDLGPWLEALGRVGVPAVLLREPHLGRSELEALVAVARQHIGLVIVHDRNPHARALDLPLHLRGADLNGPLPHGVFGVSCHDRSELARAFDRGAAYALLSPVWSPTSKPDDRPPLGLEGYLALAAGRPVLALGGVHAPRLREIEEAGGHGGAVLGALFGQPTVEGAARVGAALVQALGPS